MGYTVDEINAILPTGYTLINYPKDISINMATTLHVQCDKKHDWLKARLGNIKTLGTRCPLCTNEHRRKEKLINFEEIKKRFLDKGYDILSGYAGYAHTITIKCIKCGHIRTSTGYNVTHSCKNCDLIKRKQKALLKLENRLKEKGYTLLNEIDTSLKLTEVRLHIKCDNGHTYWIGCKSFLNKDNMCKSCRNLERLDLSLIRLRLDPGYQVNGVYINEHSPLTFTCPHENTYLSTWNKYQQGGRCTCEYCYRKLKVLTPQHVHIRLAERNLKWIGNETEYVNTRSVLTLQCTRNENHAPFTKIFFHMYANSVYCPDCQYTGISVAEIELKKYLEAMNFRVEKYRKLGFEIDIYLPDYKIGIEYNGLFHHNETTKENNYHQNKYEVCKQNEIILISIYEDEYTSNPLKIKEYLKYILQKENIDNIKTKDCEFTEVTKQEAMLFYSKYCMIGIPERNIIKLRHFGLRYATNLIAVASFNDGDDVNTLDVNRYAYNFKFNVENGIEYIIEQYLHTYGKHIVKLTYNFDRRYPHQKAPKDFIFEKINPPEFTFVRGRERRTLYQLRIKKEDEINTVIQQRKKQGWARIFDCGHEIWSKNIDIAINELQKEEALDPSKTMCWQYLLRQKYLKEDLEDCGLTEEDIAKLRIKDFTFSYADTKENEEIKNFILRYEWLGRMPLRPTHRFIARYKGILAGVIICAVPNTFSYILGENNKHLEKLISRGASVSWAPKNLGSALVMYAIRWLVQNTHFRVFTAYSDPEANEIGTIYQACNFYYLGNTYGTKILYFDPINPSAGWFTGRIFKKLNRIKQYAKNVDILWDINWNERWTVLWDKIPNEIKVQITKEMEIHENRCLRKEAEMKHKYCYILGKTKKETKILRDLFLSKNKIFEYPKRNI
jgi:hypothetical protein